MDDYRAWPLLHQCPGCWSYGLHRIPENGGWIECDCGEKMDVIDLRAADYRGAVCLTDEERKRVLWWLHQPVPPGPMKDLDVRIIEKLARSGGR